MNVYSQDGIQHQKGRLRGQSANLIAISVWPGIHQLAKMIQTANRKGTFAIVAPDITQTFVCTTPNPISPALIQREKRNTWGQDSSHYTNLYLLAGTVCCKHKVSYCARLGSVCSELVFPDPPALFPHPIRQESPLCPQQASSLFPCPDTSPLLPYSRILP